MKTRLLLLTAAALLLKFGGADAATFNWNNPGTGDWNNPANWVPSGPPAGPDDAFVDNGGIATATSATATASNVHVASSAFSSGGIQLTSNASATFSLGLNVGILGAGNFSASGSSFSVGSGGVVIGSGSSASGNLTLLSGSTASVGGDTLVGNFGNGLLLVTGASTYNASASGQLVAGSQSGSFGAIQVISSSQLLNAGTATIGGAGTGVLTVANGSAMTATYLRVGHQNTGAGNATLSNATMTVSQDLLVGNFGLGLLTISSGGNLTTSGVDHAIGRAASGNGTVVVTGAGSQWTFNGTLSVGESGEGRLDVLAGASLFGAAIEVAEFNNSGLLRVSGAGSNATLSGNVTSQDRIQVDNGGRLVAQNVYMFNTANTTVSGTAGSRGTLEAFYVESQDTSDVLIFNGGVFRARGNSTEVFGGFSEFGPGGTLVIQSGGMFVQAAGYSIATDAQITGSGMLILQGPGTLNLTGNNVYTGGTSVESGTLLVNNLDGSGTGSGFVLVQSGATLGGNGAISGSVTIQNGATLAPGNSPGLLSTGSLSVNGTLAMELNGLAPGFQYDQVNVTGSVSFFGGSSLSLTVGFTPSIGDLFFLVVNDGSDSVSGLLNGWSQNATFSLGGYNWQISYEGDFDSLNFLGGNDVVLQVIPEPSTWALLAVGAGIWLVVRRRAGRQGGGAVGVTAAVSGAAAALVAAAWLLPGALKAADESPALDLAQRRALKKYQEQTWPKHEAAIKEVVSPETNIVVDWEKLALKDQAENYNDPAFFDQTIFEPLVAALKEVASDEMGREAVREKLAKILVTYDFETAPISNYANGVKFEGGTLTVNFTPFSNAGEPETQNFQDRVKAIVQVLEKRL